LRVEKQKKTFFQERFYQKEQCSSVYTERSYCFVIDFISTILRNACNIVNSYRFAENSADQILSRLSFFLFLQSFYLSQRQLQRLVFVSSLFLQLSKSCHNSSIFRQAFNLFFDCFVSSNRRLLYYSIFVVSRSELTQTLSIWRCSVQCHNSRLVQYIIERSQIIILIVFFAPSRFDNEQIIRYNYRDTEVD